MENELDCLHRVFKDMDENHQPLFYICIQWALHYNKPIPSIFVTGYTADMWIANQTIPFMNREKLSIFTPEFSKLYMEWCDESF